MSSDSTGGTFADEGMRATSIHLSATAAGVWISKLLKPANKKWKFLLLAVTNGINVPVRFYATALTSNYQQLLQLANNYCVLHAINTQCNQIFPTYQQKVLLRTKQLQSTVQLQTKKTKNISHVFTT